MDDRASVFFPVQIKGQGWPVPPKMSAPPPLTFLTDVFVISSDLISGKSIPVLVGITRLPIDRFLAGVVLSMGAAAGTVFSHYTSRLARGLHPLAQANRFVQLFFALFLSLSLLLSLSRGIHYGRGVILSIIPAFCVVSQSLPQRASTPWVAVLVSLLAYWYCMTIPVQTFEWVEIPAYKTPRVLRGLNQDSPEAEAAGVWDVVLRALQLFVLAFYACVQHAPTEVYFLTRNDPLAVYASSWHARHPHYALFVGLFSGFFRVCLWYSVVFFQNNTLHVMLENDLSRGGWDWAGCVLFSTALLFSACWTATQIREQAFFPSSSIQERLKLVVCALALAALHRQRDPQAMFGLTDGLSGLSLVVTALTLKEW